MRAHAIQVETPWEIFEIVGTGGDNAHSFNISTTSALVAAAGGMKVAKHGNRAASSKCGTADCLEALGVNIDQDPDLCRKLLDEVGMCFFFAQKYHASMKYVGPIRKELGFRTVFNILGPLTNPGKPQIQLLGVYDDYLVEPLAKVLMSLNVKRGMVVYGLDKLDEISLSSPTLICEFKDGWYKTYMVQRNVGTSTDFASLDAVRTWVRAEYCREFIAEGQAFYTYKRAGATTMFGTDRTMGESDYILPLPDTEYNPNNL